MEGMQEVELSSWKHGPSRPGLQFNALIVFGCSSLSVRFIFSTTFLIIVAGSLRCPQSLSVAARLLIAENQRIRAAFCVPSDNLRQSLTRYDHWSVPWSGFQLTSVVSLLSLIKVRSR